MIGYLSISAAIWVAYFIIRPVAAGEKVELPYDFGDWFGGVFAALFFGFLLTVLLAFVGIDFIGIVGDGGEGGREACSQWENRGRGLECVD